jgi:hypothetical protein
MYTDRQGADRNTDRREETGIQTGWGRQVYKRAGARQVFRHEEEDMYVYRRAGGRQEYRQAGADRYTDRQAGGQTGVQTDSAATMQNTSIEAKKMRM